ncbi:replication factor C large subunit [Candidatus Micrarchaeota archaeon]|nr:replication factor C large subunit [Candidatus Micrarchaeota archaeon]
MLFTIKYSPKKLDDIAGNEDSLTKIKQWIVNWLAGKPRRPLLIWGRPGIGKTSVAYALKEQYDLDIIEMNASELRNKDRVERMTGGTLLAGGLFGRQRIVLMDDVDILAGRKDSGGSSAIVNFIKSAPCPIILTATDIWDSKLSQVRNECETIEMKKISKIGIKKTLEKVAKIEKLSIADSTLESIAENAEGDLRAALNDLQALAPTKRDHEKDIFNLVRLIFKAPTYADAKEAVKGDIDYDLLKLWIDENIPNEYETPTDIAGAYDLLSRADIFDGRIKKSRWQLLKYSIDLTTAGVALAKKAPYRKFTKYQFPSFLRNMSRSIGRRALLKSIGMKIGSKLHTNRKEALIYLPFIRSIGKSQQENLMDFYKLEEEEFAFIMEISLNSINSVNNVNKSSSS